MGGLKAFVAVLQERLALDDEIWSYHVPNLPSSKSTEPANLVKSIALPSQNQPQSGIRLRFVDAPSNRITWSEPLDSLILLSTEGFRLQSQSATGEEKPQFCTARESAEYLSRLLLAGIIVNDVHYHFFAHSNSQLKSRSCFLYAASKSEISSKIESMGDFSNLKSVAKKAKRIGLLFSTAEMGLKLPIDRCEDVADIERGDYNFTDGCGLISRTLAKQLVQRRNIAYRNKRYLPSVFQIRYRGYKGVLTLDLSLKGKTDVQFRHSMRKFKDARDLTLSVVDYSKPYAYGFLNDEIVLLLSSLGINTSTLLQRQGEYLELLQRVNRGDLREVFRFLGCCNRLDLAEKVLLEGFESVQQSVKGLVKQEYAKMINKCDEQRCRILIPESRLLFGVCDPSAKQGQRGLIKEGCCFLRITHDGDGQARTIVSTEVLVTRNPCLHPGDLQKFRAVDVPELSHLVDCIVFPTQGRRPSADLMSGGDLDGDKFFVTWDKDIIPSTISQAAEYPGVKEPITFKPISGDDRAEYFAKYTNASLGRVKNLYLKWARLKGAMSSECQQLNRLFSQCVDGNRIKVPTTLDDPPEPAPSNEPFILDALHSTAKERIEAAADYGLDYSDFPMETLDFLLNRDNIAISEFELIQLILRWCDKNGAAFRDFMNSFDFRQLSNEQQAWLLGRLPPMKDAPALIRNGLLQSNLVTRSELHQFKLDRFDLHWRSVFDSSQERMGRFFHVACRSLELYHKKLIILRVDERLTLAIYIPKIIEKATEVQVNDSVRVFAMPRSQESNSPGYIVRPTKINYVLYCDEVNLQLYERKRGNTWVFLTRSQKDSSSYQNIEERGVRRRALQQTIDEGVNYDCRASVALQKISKGIQSHVGRLNRAGILDAEIYVISNRDTQSLQLLDMWLHFVDTQEVLPLFEEAKAEYVVPQIKNVDWDEVSPSVAGVIRARDISKISQLASLQEIEEALRLLVKCEERVLLRDAYLQLVQKELADGSLVDQQNLTRCLLRFLTDAPYLIGLFLESSRWKAHREHLKDDLNSNAATLLMQLVLSANSMRSFIQHPFRILLQELNILSIQHLVHIVELIALSVREPETALDLLLDIVEPETSRLMIGHPKATSLCVKSLIGIALDHIDESSKSKKTVGEPLHLILDGGSDGFTVVKATLRLDSPLSKLLKTGDHVRLTASSPPQNAPLAKLSTMDAVVLSSDNGEARLRCIHDPPSYMQACNWNLVHCGSFVTTKTMLDALLTFYSEKTASCLLFEQLVGLKSSYASKSTSTLPFVHRESLNASQNRALEAAMTHYLTLLWGPPGTGKTHTIVAILIQLLNAMPKNRVLVAAPTHNAVDNILQKFLKEDGIVLTGVRPLRVSTSVNKVATSLRAFTCDAMVGKDINSNHKARNQAQKRVQESRLIFTTCIGAGLGLLRTEKFETVLVDEASQQTEPETLVPLVKGCQRAVLVGDHVQLRATVQKTAIVAGLDVSLFERHYSLPQAQGIAKVMLDTQYRMHREICAYSSELFYEGKLGTAVPDKERVLTPSRFPWPSNARKVFVPCSSPEDIGHQSKSNMGQAKTCKAVCELLTAPAASNPSSDTEPAYLLSQIAILTPYTRQKELLKSQLPGYDVSSIDGYQGREADIIIFVTTRCNVHYELGFLNDMRRLNVAMTRAKYAVIAIGDKATLTSVSIGEEILTDSKKSWKRLLDQCAEVNLDPTITEVQNEAPGRRKGQRAG